MKNKYFKKICVIFASVSILLSGCDFLNTKIDTDLTPESLETSRSVLWYFGNAMYSSLQSGFSALDDNFFAAASDEAQRTRESGYTYTFNRGIINPDNVSAATNSIYDKCYEGIRACNFFLDFAKNGEELLAWNYDIEKQPDNFARDLRNLGWYRAEAHICRAYYYMELIKRFGGVPIVETTLDKAENPGKIPRSSYDEVVGYIVNEIDTYKDSLQIDWKTHPDNVSRSDGRFDLKSALAIKARTLLYAASPLNNPNNDVTKWERAAQAAWDVISTMNYRMPTNRDYGSYFQGNNATANDESIFVLRVGVGNSLEKANYPIATVGGNSGITPTEDLVAAYEYLRNATPDPLDPYKGRDPRLAATVVTNGSTWNNRIINQSPGGIDDMRNSNASKTGYYLKKFLSENLNLTQGATNPDVWIIFRYADVLLMFAEAMNEVYGPNTRPDGISMSARQAITEVRSSASTTLQTINISDVTLFREAVKRERRVELAFEDHRYWDLLRWKDAEIVLNKPVQGVVVNKNEAGNFVYQIKDVGERVFNEKNYRLPFTRSEIVNSGGTLKQNEGY